MILEFLKCYEGQIKGKFDARSMALANTKNRGGFKQDMQAGAKIKFSFYKLYADLENFNAS